jgi:outer membrane protein
MSVAAPFLAVAVVLAGASRPADAKGAMTLQSALAAAYANNPTVQTARAQARSVDENVPAALAGWRPTVTVQLSGGRGFGNSEVPSTDLFGRRFGVTESSLRNIFTEQGTITQPVYTGGKVPATLHRAKNQVFSQRAQLLATEEQILGQVVQAYVNVVQDARIVEIDAEIEQILARQLQSTNDRFRVGELTRTDVAQAEAALAGATAARQTAEGNLQTARAQYFQLVGLPADNLTDPQPLRLPERTLVDAAREAGRNNPNVVAALFNVSAAKDAFDVAYAAIMPNVSVQATGFKLENQAGQGFNSSGGEFLATLTVPIFQGGSEYAGIRQARQNVIAAQKQLEDQRRTAVEQASSAWDDVLSARAAIQSNQAAVRAQTIAVEGLQREALVGSRTTQDVLNGIQVLLQDQTSLVQSTATYVAASYSVAQAVGRLTARDLGINVPYYDYTAYYKAVRNLWIGTGDFATNQPGR